MTCCCFISFVPLCEESIPRAGLISFPCLALGCIHATVLRKSLGFDLHSTCECSRGVVLQGHALSCLAICESRRDFNSTSAIHHTINTDEVPDDAQSIVKEWLSFLDNHILFSSEVMVTALEFLHCLMTSTQQSPASQLWVLKSAGWSVCPLLQWLNFSSSSEEVNDLLIVSTGK